MSCQLTLGSEVPSVDVCVCEPVHACTLVLRPCHKQAPPLPPPLLHVCGLRGCCSRCPVQGGWAPRLSLPQTCLHALLSAQPAGRHRLVPALVTAGAPPKPAQVPLRLLRAKLCEGPGEGSARVWPCGAWGVGSAQSQCLAVREGCQPPPSEAVFSCGLAGHRAHVEWSELLVSLPVIPLSLGVAPPPNTPAGHFPTQGPKTGGSSYRIPPSSSGPRAAHQSQHPLSILLATGPTP